MDEYADIYYVDEARNASNDHRAGSGSAPAVYGPTPFVVGGRPVPVGALQSRTVYMQPAQPQVSYAYGRPVVGQPMASPLGSLFGNLNAGQLIAMLAEAFAAFRSLPAAPAPTSDVGTDIANSVTYDTALAQYAKTDEQIRTIGHLVARLVR